MFTGKLIAGVALLAVTLVFLMAVVFGKVHFDKTRHGIVRLFCSIGAGTAGLLMTGDAVLSFTGQLGASSTLIFNAVGGVALFGLVWLTFGPFAAPPPVTSEVSLGVPSGWTFEQLLQSIAGSGRALIDFQGFSREQLDAPVRPENFKAPDTKRALELSRSLVRSDGFPQYDVTFNSGLYTVTRK